MQEIKLLKQSTVLALLAIIISGKSLFKVVATTQLCPSGLNLNSPFAVSTRFRRRQNEHIEAKKRVKPEWFSLKNFF